MEKQISYKHGVSEQGNLQTIKITKIIDASGEIIDEQISPPYTPIDTKNMDGFDPRSKEIVAIIQTVKPDFEAEKQKITGKGLEEAVSHDRTIDDLGRISVRRITRIYDDGIEVTKKYHRSWIMPGQDPSGNDVISKPLAQKLHTSTAMETYKAKVKAQQELV